MLHLHIFIMLIFINILIEIVKWIYVLSKLCYNFFYSCTLRTSSTTAATQDNSRSLITPEIRELISQKRRARNI